MKLPFSPSLFLVRKAVGGVGFKEPQRLLTKSNRLASSSVRFGLPLQQWRSGRAITTVAEVREQSDVSSPQAARDVGNESAENDALLISDQVRLLMRRVPYPVAIITATDPNSPVEDACRGMTVSSFNTVTLNPEPVISFNVRRPSETLSALQSSGRFLVHLLAPSQTTAILAREFSKGNHNLSMLSGEGDFEFAQHSSDDTSCSRIPILRRRSADAADQGNPTTKPEDFAFVFECKLNLQSLEVYDHTIVVGTVVRVVSQHLPCLDAVTGESSSATDLCLTYANTKFWKMGREI